MIPVITINKPCSHNRLIMLRRMLTQMLMPKQPPYARLTMEHMPGQLVNQYLNPIFWTPRYQKLPYSEELLKYIRFLQRKKTLTNEDFKQMVENILLEYSQVLGKDATVDKDIVVPPSSVCAFHGQVDWLCSLKGTKCTPIMFTGSQLNPAVGIAMALSSLHIRCSERAEESGQIYGYSIITTGQEWQLIRIDRYMKLQKSIVLEGANKYRNFHQDEEAVSVALGMIDYCLERPTPNVEALEKAYEYLDERKYMMEAESEAEAKKTSLIGKLLLEYYKRRY